MGKQNQSVEPNPPEGPPPSYPSQVHLDAGPVPGQSQAGAGAAPASPYNNYGGFNNPSHKPSQQHLDPRAPQSEASYYGGSPAPPQGYGAYGQHPAAAQGYYGGAPGYGPPMGMQYGPPQPGYGPGYGPGYAQGGYYGAQQRGYYDDRHHDGTMGALLGCCAGLACLDLCCLF